MAELTGKLDEKLWSRIIWGASIAVPVVVGVLLTPDLIPKIELSFGEHLSLVNALINTTVSILLIMGFIFIRTKRIKLHRTAMISAFSLSALFLVVYVLNHLTNGSKPYCDEGLVPAVVYYVILISHIGLSVFIIPLASFSILRALNGTFERHKKLARITFPFWLYVAVTGPLVYLFNSPCG